MKILVTCHGHQFYREIEQILQLFFGEMQILFFDEQGVKQLERMITGIGSDTGEDSFDPIIDERPQPNVTRHPSAKQAINDVEQAKADDPADYHMVVTINREHPVTAHVELTAYGKSHSFSSVHRDSSGSVSGSEVEAEENLEHEVAAKRAIRRALIRALEEETGVEQPWGILTGIRPNKLFHKLLENGQTREEAGRYMQAERLVSPQKVDKLYQIVVRQFAVLPDLHHLQDEVSIYIGIPFCPTRCAYCTFPAYAIDRKSGSVGGFLEGLLYEIKHVGEWLKERNIGVTTVYFGGGTPTSIEADEMEALFGELFQSFPLHNLRELTVEAGRPDTITPEKIEIMKKWRVDRISINPQTFTQETLVAIGRHHTVEETVEKFLLSREMGMDNINMDLIIGLPGEDRHHFAHSLREVEKLMPESLTVHTLSFKRASSMTQNREKYKVAGREEVDYMMKMAEDWTAAHGYAPYYLYRQKNILGNLENVGYALPGKECLYNIIIMEEKQTIIGLGSGAAGKHIHPQTGKIRRWGNPKDPKAYQDSYRELTERKLQDLNEIYGFAPERS